MVELKDIYAAYLDTRKNKKRSEDCVTFESHLERNLADLCKAINNRTLQPTAYTFIASSPKPREVFATDFATRIAHHYLDLRLRPIIESKLTDVTFNNRIGYGCDAAFNKLVEYIYEVTEGYTKEAWVISADLSGYFPNASQDIAYKQLIDLVQENYEGEDKDDILWLVGRCVYSYPTEHCYRKSPQYMWNDIPDAKSLFKKEDGIGAAIGYLIWQNEMNFYLNGFDHYMIDVCNFHYLRFVDDMRWVVTPEEKDTLLAMFPQFRAMLAECGCKFNEKKFSCQKASRGGNFLGYTYKGRRVYVSNRIKKHFYATIHRFNKKVRSSQIDAFLASLNSYTGILKRCNGYRILEKGLSLISPDWFKYIEFDAKRQCFRAKSGYTYRERLERQYSITNKYKPNDNRISKVAGRRHLLRYDDRAGRRGNPPA